MGIILGNSTALFDKHLLRCLSTEREFEWYCLGFINPSVFSHICAVI